MRGSYRVRAHLLHPFDVLALIRRAHRPALAGAILMTADAFELPTDAVLVKSVIFPLDFPEAHLARNQIAPDINLDFIQLRTLRRP